MKGPGVGQRSRTWEYGRRVLCGKREEEEEEDRMISTSAMQGLCEHTDQIWSCQVCVGGGWENLT